MPIRTPSQQDQDGCSQRNSGQGDSNRVNEICAPESAPWKAVLESDEQKGQKDANYSPQRIGGSYHAEHDSTLVCTW